MKRIIDVKGNWLFTLLIMIGGLVGCFPESEDLELEPLPTASFTVTPVANKTNTFLVKSTTQGGFMFFWDKGTGFLEGSEIDTVYFSRKGDYEVKLRVATSGGSVETSQTVNVPEDDPDACFGALAMLTDCGSKTWILQQPEGGALFVGPPGLGSAWWQNSSADVGAADRVCLFDNEYTFTAEGVFIFDNNGTMRVDDEGGNPWPTDIGLAIGCYDMAQIPSKYQAWGSGNHNFEVNGSTLKLIGTGAHLGLYKVGETGTTDTPGAFINYTIESITEDLLVVKKEYDWGGWRFTLKAKE